MSDFSLSFDDLVSSTSVNNPFVETKKLAYESDNRFYQLTKDSDGNGQALVSFLPDAERKTVLQVYKFNITNHVNGSRRFINMISPTTCGQPDPIQEEWQRLWNSGDREGARQYSRSIRYITNIKVVRDPENPDNEGKIFLYEMSAKLFDKLKQALCPSDKEIALGASRKEIFNPTSGWIFKLTARKQPSGITTYDSSEFVYNPDIKVYKSVDEAIADIKNKTHKLSWFLEPSNYPSYDTIADKLAWLKGEKSGNTSASAVKVEVNNAEPVPEIKDEQPNQPAKKHRIDDLDAAIDELTSF